MAESAYDAIRTQLEKQRYYTDDSGNSLYVFKEFSRASFIFTTRTRISNLGDFECALEGLRGLFPVPTSSREETLKRFGVEDMVAQVPE